MKETLLQRIADRQIVVGVVGLGYVGLPLAVAAAQAGFRTIGFDVQSGKVGRVNAGKNYIGDIDDALLTNLVHDGHLRATTCFEQLTEVDFVTICVPTPLDAHQQPDISYVRQSAGTIAKHLHRHMMVVLESTTYPGTTEELIKPLLETSGLKCSEDFYLGFSPERVDPGNAVFKTQNTPKVVGGVDADATEVISIMYEQILQHPVFRVSSPAVAEMTKILENTYRNVNIGFINEMAMLCHRMHIPLWEVIDAAATKPFGFMPFYPGPGLGGHCIPLDPYYLSWKAREYSFHTSMIEASMMVNDRMPEYCVSRAADMLNRRLRKALNGARVLVLGVAYKADIDDCRESPAIRIIDKLKAEGAHVSYYDPYVMSFRAKDGIMTGEKELTPELLESVDMVIITTAHKQVDYQLVQRHARAVFDTKNATRQLSDKHNIEVL